MRLHALVSDHDAALLAVRGGATVVQLRLKDATTPERIERGRAIRSLCAREGVTFVVDDDVHAALQLGADGVHLGRGDDGADDAVGYGLLLGLSAASVDEAVAAVDRGAAYVGAGPVWDTPSKPDADPAIGVEGLARICEAVPLPVVAIGGVDASNAGSCIGAGAAGVAVIRAVAETAALRRAVDAAL